MDVDQRKCAGRQLLFWGSLVLWVTAGYECYGRMDTLVWTVKGVYNLCRHEGVNFLRAWTYFEPGMFELVSYLCVCAVVGLLGVLLRNKARAGYFFLGAVAAIFCWGWLKLGLYDWRSMLQIRNLQLIPMAMIALGSVINMVQFYRQYTHRRKDERDARRPRYTQAM